MATDQDVQDAINRINALKAQGLIVPAGKPEKAMMSDQEVQSLIDDYNKNKKQPFLNEAALGVAAGTEETAAALTRILAKLPSKTLKQIHFDVQNFSDMLNKKFEQGQPNIINKGIKEFTNLGTELAIPGGGEKVFLKGAIKALPKAVEGASKLLESAPAGTGVAVRAAKSIPSGAAVGALSVSPDQNISTGAIIGSLLGPVGSIIGDTIGFGIGSLTKQKAIEDIAERSDATPEQLQHALESSSGNPILAGNALNDPNVLKMELNTLPTMTGFSKTAINKLKTISGSLMNQANDIYNSLTLNIGKSDLSDKLKNAVIQNTKKLQATKRSLYKKVNALAKRDKTSVKLDNFGKTAKKLKKNFSRVARETGVEKSGEGIKSLNRIIAKVYPKINESPNGLILPQDLIDEMKAANKGKTGETSLNTANFAKSALNNKAYKYKVSGDADLSSIYQQLADALEKDINNAINESESPELKEAYEKAQKFYKENIVPLQDKNIAGILNTKVDPDNITSTFIPTGEKGKGRINLLNKILKNAPGSEKYLLSDYLKPAIHENEMGEEFISPNKLYRLLNGLGDDRLKMLVKDPEALQAIKDFKSNMKNGMDALNLMLNPINGSRNLANMNALESAKIISDTVQAGLSGKVIDLLSKGVGYGTKLAEARAINDPALVQKVINIKTGVPYDTGIPYKLAKNSNETLTTVSKILTSLLTGAI